MPETEKEDIEASEFIKFLDRAIPEEVRAEFERYVKEHPWTTWFILSDYNINHTGYPNNVLVFTTLPEHDHEKFLEATKTSLQSDLKSKSKVYPDTVEMLKHPSLFTFAFAFEKKIRLIPDIATARKVISELLAMPEEKSDLDKAIYVKLRELQGKAQSGSFDLTGFNRLLLVAHIVSYIALQIAKNTKLEILYWLGDRDKLHSSFKGISYPLAYAICSTHFKEHRIDAPRLRHPNPEEDTYFDPYIRIPDHFAGPLANMKFPGTSINTGTPKHDTILKDVLAGNKRFCFVSLAFSKKPAITVVQLRAGAPMWAQDWLENLARRK
ncbi:MAG: hypothetical protein K2X29_13235 [Candidatus Obscuribacterales bacterium]|nr:hypothetical protein [Candidatus Obscuribacterales bacterium]